MSLKVALISYKLVLAENFNPNIKNDFDNEKI
jgi:hypothetical protein